MDQVKIGKLIAECCKNKKMTQASLAEQLGITDKSVSKWENGISLCKWHSYYFCVDTTVYTNFSFKTRNLDWKMFICIYKKSVLYIHFASAK